MAKQGRLFLARLAFCRTGLEKVLRLDFQAVLNNSCGYSKDTKDHFRSLEGHLRGKFIRYEGGLGIIQIIRHGRV